MLLENVSMYSIKDWLYKNKDLAKEVMEQNERYIFFEEYKGGIKGKQTRVGGLSAPTRAVRGGYLHLACGAHTCLSLDPLAPLPSASLGSLPPSLRLKSHGHQMTEKFGHLSHSAILF